ncbi:hypothetical protein HORIV_60180 [Vreelandella olivaria]|uniref:Uncharacterized protein n=1 Tax=Vreelandella olivaria TaxID=390919 RepID=A0ABM7GS95_9GAMM|nr:hypothetical protein HORIV_60180 [Halomonas olivaria]
MGMQHAVNGAVQAVEGGMQVTFCARLAVAFKHLSIKVAEQQIIGLNAGFIPARGSHPITRFSTGGKIATGGWRPALLRRP